MDVGVVIIGAGMAGLSAADHLTRNNFTDFVILETENRPGGRMRTVQFGRDPTDRVELGANFIHGSSLQNHVFVLGHELGVDNLFIRPKRSEGWFMTPDGRCIPKPFVDRVFQVYLATLDECDELTKKDPQRAVTQIVDGFLWGIFEQHIQGWQETDQQDARAVYGCLLNYLRINLGDQLSQVPVAAYGFYVTIPADDVVVLGGMQSIIQRMIDEKLPKGCIRFNHRVERVDSSAETTTVTCENGNVFRCKQVVVTLPIGVMKRHHKELFHPPLPARKAGAIERMGFGRVGKIFLRYERPFWRKGEVGVRLAWTKDAQVEPGQEWVRRVFSFEEVPTSSHVLVGWISGPEVEIMERLPEPELKKALTSLLRRFLNNHSIPEPVEILRTQWCGNPNSLGAYSYPSTNTKLDDHDAIQEPIRGRSGAPQLLFAGEATYKPWFGTIHGARISGIEAARAILGPKSAVASRL